jgi:CSLREA domain-containing protein
MRFPTLTLYSLVCVLALASPALPQRVNATVYTVTSTADSFDSSPGDGACADAQGRCTFRAAINEIGASKAVEDAIIFALPHPSTIDLTLGEILLQGQLTILGPGPDKLTIQRSSAVGTPEFRLIRLVGGGGGNLDIRSLTLKNGRSAQGGAIYVDQSILRMTNVVVSGNQATDGGGIYSYGGSVRITRSLFHSNAATGSGGAIALATGSMTFPVSVISDSTLTNNLAQSSGAIANARNLSLVNNTITHNSAADVSGITTSPSGTTYAINNIIGSNQMPQVTLSGAFVSLGNNIITDARNSTGFEDGVLNDRVGISNSIDPMVGPLADNGGGTLTRSLLAGSMAINAGNNCTWQGGCGLPTGTNVQLAYDQRSRYSRLAGSVVDIGAFELNASNKPWFISFRSSIVGMDASGAFYANSTVVLTDPVTGEKRYSVVTPSGEFRFNDVDWTSTSVIEIRAKRRLPFAVKVFPY